MQSGDTHPRIHHSEEPTLNPPMVLAGQTPPQNLAKLLAGAGGGLALNAAGLVGMTKGLLSAPVGVTLAVVGLAIVIGVAGYFGWSLARMPVPIPRRRRRRRAAPRVRAGTGPRILVFGCAQAPTVSWVDRLIELPPEERRAMAVRAPRVRRSARWLAELLQLLEHHHATLERIVLVMDAASYPPPIRAALDRLTRAHFNPPPGQSGRIIVIEHLLLEDPDDPQQVFVKTAGKLHELTIGRSSREIAVAPTAASSPTDMGLTLAASNYACELIYFRSSSTDPGPERFPTLP